MLLSHVIICNYENERGAYALRFFIAYFQLFIYLSPFVIQTPRRVGQYTKGGTVHRTNGAGVGRGGVIFRKGLNMKIIYKSLSELCTYENNPRNNALAVDAVANSIQEFGFQNPILISPSGEIVAGHTRYKAAQKLGMERVPCVIVEDLTPEQIQAFRIIDNKTAELANWDNEKLKEELSSLSMDWTEFGFHESEISALLSDFSPEDFDGLFVDENPKPKEEKTIQCPHCGQYFTP